MRQSCDARVFMKSTSSFIAFFCFLSTSLLLSSPLPPFLPTLVLSFDTFHQTHLCHPVPTTRANMASKSKSEEDVQQAPVSIAANLSAQVESLARVVVTGVPVRCYAHILTRSSLVDRSTNDVVHLEPAQVPVHQTMPDLTEHLAKNRNLIMLMYADSKLDPDDCTYALTEVKVRPKIPVQAMFKQLTLSYRTTGRGRTMPSVTRLSCVTSQIIPRTRNGDSSW